MRTFDDVQCANEWELKNCENLKLGSKTIGLLKTSARTNTRFWSNRKWFENRNEHMGRIWN